LFCFLTTTLHFHPHIDHVNEKTIENIVSYKNDLDYHFSNECNSCLIKNNKSELFYIIEYLGNHSPILFKNKSEVFLKHGVSFFNIYSRPPPASIS
jgi:hypothetical protein